MDIIIFVMSVISVVESVGLAEPIITVPFAMARQLKTIAWFVPCTLQVYDIVPLPADSGLVIVKVVTREESRLAHCCHLLLA